MLIGKYRLFRIIGDGTFSTVKLGVQIFTNQPVAVKIISKSSLTEQSQIDRLHERINVIQRLDHPGIIKLIEVIEDETAYYIVLEYCGGGELFDFIIARTRVEEPLAKRFFKQIVLAVGYCHSQNVIHRDLKPENLLLTENNTVKLIDFGLCNTHADQPLHDRCGSACYIAPEALTTSEYFGIPADIWALGVILYALVDGSLPWNYQDPNQMFQQITTGSFPMPAGISLQCQDMLKGILNPDVSQRFSIDAILMHPWLFGVGNVFPLPKPSQPPGTGEPHLNLSLGGFSASDVRPEFLLCNAIHQNAPNQTPTMSIQTIFEGNSIQQNQNQNLNQQQYDNNANSNPDSINNNSSNNLSLNNNLNMNVPFANNSNNINGNNINGNNINNNVNSGANEQFSPISNSCLNLNNFGFNYINNFSSISNIINNTNNNNNFGNNLNNLGGLNNGNSAIRSARSKPVQPRSISLDAATMTETGYDDDQANTHHGPIMSQTISHRDPAAVAQQFESVLMEQGISYRRLSPLMFQLFGPDLQLTAEVCRLYGFRNVYVVAFKRIQGESWGYTQFVSQILGVFKA
ncbi:hypothetical protein TRFO_40797 [Tritrichomonas foetus]|uniref:non-specific serine/threonine protein kinase n=1 Tax=Tritrichomonas foetus TaxID=1144522 RepID=A0A1J4J616_9EUKA|nr:hypothetical protein TRFO_40797 [Tritrichomonas foetus]|eukprot:OHS92893.1 hypothetical protein TRFO_40797 [Tritrichomonas foetus]